RHRDESPDRGRHGGVPIVGRAGHRPEGPGRRRAAYPRAARATGDPAEIRPDRWTPAGARRGRTQAGHEPRDRPPARAPRARQAAPDGPGRRPPRVLRELTRGRHFAIRALGAQSRDQTQPFGPFWLTHNECLMWFGEAAAFVGVSLLVICTPGQDTALTIRNTLLGNRRTGAATALGVSAGQATWTVATSAGLAVILAASAPLFLAVRLTGRAYLLSLRPRSVRRPL